MPQSDTPYRNAGSNSVHSPLRKTNMPLTPSTNFRSPSTISSASPRLDKPLPRTPSPVSFSVPIKTISNPNSPEFSCLGLPIFTNAHGAWIQRYLSASLDESWIDKVLGDSEIFFGSAQDGYAWKLGCKVYERADLSSPQPFSTALYECSQIKGKVRGPKAYMKISMQIPCYRGPYNPASTKPIDTPECVLNEIAALKRLSHIEGETVVPRMLASKVKKQTTDMWVPDGFISFVVLQRISGIRLEADSFSSLPAKLQDEIKISFRRALQNLWEAGVLPQSCSIDKLMWHPKEKKCYIIDLQGAEVVDRSLRWWDQEYHRWGLASTQSKAQQVAPLQGGFGSPKETIDHKIKLAIEKATLRNSPSSINSQEVRLHLDAHG